MLNIPQTKLVELIDKARNKADILLPIDKLSKATADRKYRCGTVNKSKGLNGWYIIKISYNTDFITVCYGNWEDNSSYKHHISLNDSNYHIKQSTYVCRKDLQIKIENERKIQEQEKQNKLNYYINKFNQLPYCKLHEYTTRKGIENLSFYNLKHDNYSNLLCIPFTNNLGAMQGYQIIDSNGTKRFRGSVSGCYFLYPNINPDENLFCQSNSFYILGEGFATVLSAKECIEDYFDSRIFMAYALVGFNCGNLDKVIKATTHYQLDYFLLIDNDSDKTHNAGVETAKQLIINNPNAKIHPIVFNNENDANDYIQLNGAEAFIKLAYEQSPIMKFITQY